MLIADKHIITIGTDGKAFSLSEACKDVQAHSLINDDVVIFSLKSIKTKQLQLVLLIFKVNEQFFIKKEQGFARKKF
jgi:hypothetical protein